MNPSLAATHPVDPRQAIVNQFNKGSGDPETWTGVILVVAATLILLLVLHFLLYYERRADGPRLKRDPHKLFRELMSRLPLNLLQRELLKKVARDLNLEHPANLLISPALFAKYGRQWLGEAAPGMNKYEAELDRIARHLFLNATPR